MWREEGGREGGERRERREERGGGREREENNVTMETQSPTTAAEPLVLLRVDTFVRLGCCVKVRGRWRRGGGGRRTMRRRERKEEGGGGRNREMEWGKKEGCTNFLAICGDGIKKGTEECDDGNIGSGDGCR
jgi:hypothetical protein